MNECYKTHRRMHAHTHTQNNTTITLNISNHPTNYTLAWQETGFSPIIMKRCFGIMTLSMFRLVPDKLHSHYLILSVTGHKSPRKMKAPYLIPRSPVLTNTTFVAKISVYMCGF